MNSGKQPAVHSWAAFQKRQPTADELHTWFVAQGALAYGIICGLISHIIVLDLDDLDLIDHFQTNFPFLMETLAVLTGGRGGMHLYFTVDFPVQTRKFIGADLKGERSYVVGPGSVISGQTWTVTHDPGFIRHITQEELQQVIEFLPKPERHTTTISVNRQTGVDYTALYMRRVASSKQRNQSLFDVGCRMRDDGHNLDEAIHTLAQIHAQQKPLIGQEDECYEVRYKEAQRTLTSVYTHPARPHTSIRSEQGIASTFPNTIREAMLPRDNGTAFLRTLEGLSLKGVIPDQSFTRAQAYTLLKGIVGRYSIDLALKATGIDGKKIFEPVAESHARASPLDLPPADADMIKNNIFDKMRFARQKMRLSGGKNQRTANIPEQFIFPSTEVLCQKLEVKWSPGDELCLEDMKSASLYRRAYERELLKRRPGAYSQRLLADRLGVTARSIRNYHRAEDIHSLARYQVKAINWATIGHVPWQCEFTDFDLGTGGCFLEDETGKRYKPFREIAMVLLAKKKRLLYKVQQTNYYWVGDPCSPPFASKIMSWTACQSTDPKRYLENYLCELENAYELRGNQKPQHRHIGFKSKINVSQTQQCFMIVEEAPVQQQLAVSKPHKIVPVKKVTVGRTPLLDEDEENLAQMLRAEIKGLSLQKARIFVEQHGIDVLQPILRRVMWLHQHGKVHSLKAYFLRAVQNSGKKINNKQAAKPRTYRRPLPDKRKEYIAQSLYKSVDAISIFNARRLVELYGERAVLSTLSRVIWLMQRDKARNPAGLFIVAVRGAWRRIQSAGQGQAVIAAPRFKGERGHQSRRKKLL